MDWKTALAQLKARMPLGEIARALRVTYVTVYRWDRGLRHPLPWAQHALIQLARSIASSPGQPGRDK